MYFINMAKFLFLQCVHHSIRKTGLGYMDLDTNLKLSMTATHDERLYYQRDEIDKNHMTELKTNSTIHLHPGDHINIRNYFFEIEILFDLPKDEIYVQCKEFLKNMGNEMAPFARWHHSQENENKIAETIRNWTIGQWEEFKQKQPQEEGVKKVKKTLKNNDIKEECNGNYYILLNERVTYFLDYMDKAGATEKELFLIFILFIFYCGRSVNNSRYVTARPDSKRAFNGKFSKDYY